eukprot:scaffold60496_cov59-Attheya_sp.AAC.3
MAEYWHAMHQSWRLPADGSNHLSGRTRFHYHTSSEAPTTHSDYVQSSDKEDHTSSDVPTTCYDHVRSSDKEGGGIVGYRGTSRRGRVSEVTLVAGVGGKESMVGGLLWLAL